MKRLFAVILSVLMLTALTVPAVAAAETYDLSIRNTATGHTYDAYQLFAGTLSGSVLSDLTWGAAIYKDVDGDGVIEEGDYDYSADLVAAILADTEAIEQAGNTTTTLKDKFASLAGKTGTEAAQEMAKVLATLDPVGSLVLDRFAQIVGKVSGGKHLYLGDYSGTTNTSANGVYTIAGLPAGYYLVKDRDGTVPAVGDFHTKYLIDVVKTHTIDIKGEAPTVEKLINDTVNGTYGKVEDYDIFDTAYYMWQGQLPSDLLSYDLYAYTFIDELPLGIEFTRFEAVYVQDGHGKVVHTFMNLTDGDTTNDTLPAGITQSVVDNNSDADLVEQTVTLDFDDLLTLYPNIKPDHEIVVKYSTIITRHALMVEAMSNKVVLVYSNNPNGGGEGQTGTTPPDYAHAFTFDLNIDKYDAANEATKLEGVEFILYKSTTIEDTTTTYYALVVTEEDIAAGKEVNGHKLVEAYLGNIYGWTTNREEASILDTDVNGALKVEGLDADIYYLEEVKAKDGYNKLNSPIKVEITAVYNGENTPTCTVIPTYHVDNNNQGTTDVVKIANSQGTVLPSTGGVGTTLFYVFGALMVAAAVVLLVTKKRMNVEN